MRRTGSLLAALVTAGESNITLLHNPQRMGWRVSDRIVMSSTEGYSAGESEGFRIAGFGDNNMIKLAPVTVNTNDPSALATTQQAFGADLLATGGDTGIALLT
jgi:hypothetical protein